MEITPEFIKRYTKLGERHANHKLTVDLAKELKTHAKGEIPEAIIDVRRPSESEQVKDYRKQIYCPKTKNPIDRVVTSLGKIRRSQDWSIQYDNSKTSKSIADDETLDKYCEENYPDYASVTNWVFSELLKRYLLDANSLVLVAPQNIPQNANEYIKPVAMVFESDNVLDYVPNEYAVILSDETSTYSSEKGKRIYHDGKVYYFVTTEAVAKYKQVDVSGTLEEEYNYPHSLGMLPAFKVGGLFHSRKNGQTLYESRIGGMVPSLNEAAREYSDLQAEIVQHIYSEKYVYTDAECPTCNGNTLKNKEGEVTTCPTCHGRKFTVQPTPYGVHVVTPTTVAEHPVPTPPIGYIQKQTEIARLQDERVRMHIYDSLSSINMEFLGETPLSQSGVAKEVDRDELNTFVNSVAEDLVAILDKSYFFINGYRYSIVVPIETDRLAMLPKINVPEKFDILSTNVLMQEIQTAKTSNVNPVLVRAMEIDFAKKKFCTNPEISNELQAVLELDPLAGLTADEKMSYFSNNAITQVDYVISANIAQFVRRASSEDDKFYSKKEAEKRAVLEKYAQEVIDSNSVKAEVEEEVSDFEE